MSPRETAAELVYRAALRLDARDFAGFLALCDADFRYTAGAYGPEIRRQMLWIDQDKAGLAGIFETLPRHNSDQAPLTRHVTVYTVDLRDEAQHAEVTSALQVFRTTLDGGATELFAVGRIHDTIRIGEGAALLTRRHIDLQTRLLGIGSHIPF